MKTNSTLSLNNILLFLVITTGFAFLTSCDIPQKPAIGFEDEIIVFADSGEYDVLEGTFLQVFSKIIYTPQPEKLFELKRKNISYFEKFKNHKNIVLVAPINSGSMTSRFIETMIDSTVKDMIEKDSVFLITRNDMWARDQLVMILTGSSLEKMNKSMLFDHENLLYQFQNISDRRLFQNLYNSAYEKKDIEAKFLRDYGWIIYVQADFLVAMDKPRDKFVWLRRSVGGDMERWLFVHWIENASPIYLKRDSVYSIRDRVTEKFYRSMDDSAYIKIADEYKMTSETNFLGRYALTTQGLWKMSDQSMGGPFINYTFYDEKSKRIYMLDGSIFAPKYYKKKLIQQMDVILQSFLTEHDLSEDRKTDLLNEL